MKESNRKANVVKKSMVNMVNKVTLSLAADSVNSACIWVMHQPEVPQEMKEYKKYNDTECS